MLKKAKIEKVIKRESSKFLDKIVHERKNTENSLTQQMEDKEHEIMSNYKVNESDKEDSESIDVKKNNSKSSSSSEFTSSQNEGGGIQNL